MESIADDYYPDGGLFGYSQRIPVCQASGRLPCRAAERLGMIECQCRYCSIRSRRSRQSLPPGRDLPLFSAHFSMSGHSLTAMSCTLDGCFFKLRTKRQYLDSSGSREQHGRAAERLDENGRDLHRNQRLVLQELGRGCSGSFVNTASPMWRSVPTGCLSGSSAPLNSSTSDFMDWKEEQPMIIQTEKCALGRHFCKIAPNAESRRLFTLTMI